MRNALIGSFLGFALAAAFLAACGGSGSGDSQAVADLEVRLMALEGTIDGMQATLDSVDMHLDSLDTQ